MKVSCLFRRTLVDFCGGTILFTLAGYSLFVPANHLPKVFVLLLICSYVFVYTNYSNVAVLNYHTLSAASYLTFGALAAYLSIYKKAFVTSSVSYRKYQSFSFMLLWYIYSRQKIIRGTPACFCFSSIIYYSKTNTHYLIFAFIILEQIHAEHSFFKFSNFKRITQLGTFTYGKLLLPSFIPVFRIDNFRLISFQSIRLRLFAVCHHFHYYISDYTFFSKLSYSNLK